MRRDIPVRIKIFLVAFLWVSVANATPAYVQGVTHGNGSGASTTVAGTLTNPVGSGNTVFVSVGWAGTSDLVNTITDDKLNSYTIVDRQVDNTDSYTWVSGYRVNATGGPTTITATISASVPFASIVIDEFSGVPTTAVLDNHAINIQIGLVPGVPPTDKITSTAVSLVGTDLVYGSSVNVTGGGTESVGTGFTQAQHTPSAFISEFQTGVSAGSKAATFTPTATATWITYMLALQIPAGGGPVVHSRLLQGIGQ
jgi:hypothetical protein